MEKFYQFIEKELPSKGGDSNLYKFKKQTLDEMFTRANELTSRGLKDEAVLNDLIISEYSDIVDQYKEYENKKKAKKRRKIFAIANAIGITAYILSMVIVFLGISFATKAWGQTWLIPADGMLVLLVYILGIVSSRILEMRKVFHIIARVLMAIATLLISVAVFLFVAVILHIQTAWVIIFAGLFAMLFSDAIFASISKLKLTIIYWLIYIPIMGAMLYVILGGLALVSWNIGWLIILAAVVVDLIVALASMAKNNKEMKEV